MIYKYLFLILLFALNCKKSISISMVTATSMSNGLPFLALEGNEWKAEENAQYVKFHIYPDEPFLLSRVEVNSCKKEFVDKIEVFINFDEVIRKLEFSGKKAFYDFPSPVTTRSVTFNFEKNQGVCLSSVKFFDEKKKELALKTPRVVEGSATASETSAPESSYHVMNLFDSRYEYAYASKFGMKGVKIDFVFEKPQKIVALKIWNGYQRSDVHCIDNGRVKSFLIKGENYQEKISLEDIMGQQTITLPKVFEGKNLSLIVEEGFAGKNAKGFVISELRFFDGKEWFLINPYNKIQEIANTNTNKFSTVGLSEIMNKSISGQDLLYTGDETGGRDNSNWTFRFRSDGSMFLEGKTTRIDSITSAEGIVVTHSEYRTIFGLGNYEIRNAESEKLELRIFGFLREMKTEDSTEEIYGDCNGCGRDCNKVYVPDSGTTEKIFQEFIEIEKNPEGGYIIKNKKKTQNLDFDALKMDFSI